MRRAETHCRLPRAGGDGPAITARPAPGGGAPPRRRGWTRPPRVGDWARVGSPAQAGMDPRPRRQGPPPEGLPRAGGDGPDTGPLGFRDVWAPPRRRGWTRPPRVGDWARVGSPAQAGMDPRPSSARRWSSRLPRAGGDGPSSSVSLDRSTPAPPRRRGWTPRPLSTTAYIDGSPAQAGMDPTRRAGTPRSGRLPRAGGDGPAITARPAPGGGAPPRRRGWTLAHRGPTSHGPGSPAQAGMDPAGWRSGGACRRLPRAGGDGPRARAAPQRARRAPPRRRGWTPL